MAQVTGRLLGGDATPPSPLPDLKIAASLLIVRPRRHDLVTRPPETRAHLHRLLGGNGGVVSAQFPHCLPDNHCRGLQGKTRHDRRNDYVWPASAGTEHAE